MFLSEDLCLPKVRKSQMGFPGGSVVKNSLGNAGVTSLTPGSGRSHGEEENSYGIC